MCRDVSADGVGVEDALVFLRIALCLPKGTYEIREKCLFETESRTMILGLDLMVDAEKQIAVEATESVIEGV